MDAWEIRRVRRELTSMHSWNIRLFAHGPADCLPDCPVLPSTYTYGGYLCLAAGTSFVLTRFGS